MYRLWQLLVFVFIIILVIKSQAEYRAFELKIEDAQTGKFQTVFSNLDHLQYSRYYVLAKNESISYVDSWMCYENMSGFKSVCRKPDTNIQPASTVLKPNSN
ncbi:MAG: hypothetical protein A2Z20_03325 [Bdellovibrionales bacterium RBG_16_40_8]|nr:MAG: hypothetical protein A2Z20_03325 [Bdellovibrionales bacterium RBG_16_40_8]